LKRPELRDELYMQLVKQTRGNPSPSSRAKAWGMFNLVAASMPPSKDFTGLISEYVHSALQVGTVHNHPFAAEVHAQGVLLCTMLQDAAVQRSWHLLLCMHLM
jgi:hypothetical protein